MPTFTFFVKGDPVPKGSAKAFKHFKTGRIIVTQTNRDKQIPWAQAIKVEAWDEGVMPSMGPIILHLEFHMKRPKSHFRANGTLKNGLDPHLKKPDLDKLIRCVKDALTDIAYKDDSQVVCVVADKRYAFEDCGVKIYLEQR